MPNSFKVSLLKNQKDIRGLALVSVILLIQAGSVLLLPRVSLVFGFVAFALATFWVSLISHMYQHCPVFKSESLNLSLNLLLSIMIGAPVSRLHAVHMFNHHRFYRAEEGLKDWSHFSLAGSWRGLPRAVTYIINATAKMRSERNSLELPAALARSLKIERVVVLLFCALALALNYKLFLLIVLPGWFAGLALLLIANLANHDECETTSELNHSRDFLNKFESWIFLNNGFHSAHHKFPSTHWSEMPKIQELHFKDKNSRFTENSFFVYIAKAYLIP